MSLLSHLQFQAIDPSSSDDIPDGHGVQDDYISLSEQIDEQELDSFWDEVVQDIHDDPDWFTFADE